jgi:hypothetical protein
MRWPSRAFPRASSSQDMRTQREHAFKRDSQNAEIWLEPCGFVHLRVCTQYDLMLVRLVSVLGLSDG